MKKYDVFVSYAIEDRDAVALPIAEGLRRKGLSVFFGADELEPGDSISGAIYRGLKSSAYLVPVLSTSYVREWTIVEWRHMLEVEREMKTRLIHPVWHNLTKAEAGALFPALHDHFGLSTDVGIEPIVVRLARKIQKRKIEHWFRIWKRPAMITLAVVSVFVLSLGIARMMLRYRSGADHLPSEEEAQEIVASRIKAYQDEIDTELLEEQLRSNATAVSINAVRALYNYYSSRSDYFPDYYYFVSGYTHIRGRDNIQDEGIPLAATPNTAYGISAAGISQLKRNETDSTMELLLAFTDTAATGFVIDTMFYDPRNHEVHIWVTYEHCIRAIYYTMNYSAANLELYQHVRLLGFKPEEEFIVINQNGKWKIDTVR